LDAQSGSPQDHDQTAQSPPVRVVASGAHDGDDLLHLRRIGRVARPLLLGAWPAWNPRIVAGDRRRPARSSSSSDITPPRSRGGKRTRLSARAKRGPRLTHAGYPFAYGAAAKPDPPGLSRVPQGGSGGDRRGRTAVAAVVKRRNHIRRPGGRTPLCRGRGPRAAGPQTRSRPGYRNFARARARKSAERHPPAQPNGGEIGPEGMGWPLAASFAWTLVIMAPRLTAFVHGSWRYTGGFCTFPLPSIKPE